MVYNYKTIGANGASTLATNPVLLHTVTVGVKGASSNLLTLSDGVNGTVIAIIDTTAAVQQFQFDAQTSIGLWASLAAGTAASITVTFG